MKLADPYAALLFVVLWLGWCFQPHCLWTKWGRFFIRLSSRAAVMLVFNMRSIFVRRVKPTQTGMIDSYCVIKFVVKWERVRQVLRHVTQFPVDIRTLTQYTEWQRRGVSVPESETGPACQWLKMETLWCFLPWFVIVRPWLCCVVGHIRSTCVRKLNGQQLTKKRGQCVSICCWCPVSPPAQRLFSLLPSGRRRPNITVITGWSQKEAAMWQRGFSWHTVNLSDSCQDILHVGVKKSIHMCLCEVTVTFDLCGHR